MIRATLLAAFVGGAAARQVPDPAAPRVKYATPLAVAAGFAGKATLTGVNLDTLTAVTSPAAGVAVKLAAPDKKGGSKGDRKKAVPGDLALELAVPKDFRGDAVPLVFTGGGRPVAFRLPVDPPGTVPEKEPNGGFGDAQRVTLPAAVAAVISGDRDVDVVAFTVPAGAAVRVEAVTHGSPADLTLTAWDAGRHILATADDRGTGPNRTLTFTAKAAGEYFISVADASDRSGPQYGYRLRVAEANRARQ